MASRNLLPLPSREECYALSDEQCRSIQRHQDPGNSGTNREWEPEYQAELIRHYMRMLSFKQIEDIMRPRLAWTYKTYQNRYKDWLFPADRVERENTVRKLFDKIRSQEGYMELASTTNLTISNLPHTQQLQSHLSSVTEPLRVPKNFFQSPSTPTEPEPFPSRTDNRLSVSTTGTFASGSTNYSQIDDSYSSHRASIATTNSSLSFNSSYNAQFIPAIRPKHDPVAGLWNNTLRVIPCNIDHTILSWNVPFNRCNICGFSRWHSLMMNAQTVGIDTFLAAMTVLRGHPQVDFAGNYPIHFLMAAGVGLEFISNLTQWANFSPRNVFEQNPLHVLNPTGLGEHLISFLEWLKSREDPPMLFDQRDINCRTPLQNILLWPLERHIYSKILEISPLAEQQLVGLDNFGQSVVSRMNQKSLKLKASSPPEYHNLQAGIAEIKLFLAGKGRSHNRNQQYGFHDIARGARGLTYIGLFTCYICNQTNSHSNSYWEQLYCAQEHGRDRYEPDDTGMTPAQALVNHSRCNIDNTPESPSETAKMFKYLVPEDDHKLHELLHALDPEGNSLIFNAAVRGLDEILEYILSLEPESRRRAMVNFCTRDPRGIECSVLDAVHNKAQETLRDIGSLYGSKNALLKQGLIEHRKRLINCKAILCLAGAVASPNITMRWQIHSS